MVLLDKYRRLFYAVTDVAPTEYSLLKGGAMSSRVRRAVMRTFSVREWF